MVVGVFFFFAYFQIALFTQLFTNPVYFCPRREQRRGFCLLGEGKIKEPPCPACEGIPLKPPIE